MKKKKILVVSVHPDDETLGCGGTILKHKKNGDNVAWLIITNATVSNGYSIESVNQINTIIEEVSKAYEFNNVYNLNLPPSSLNSENHPKLISEISDVINEYSPETIYLVNRSDAHSDHRFAFQAVLACTKSFRAPCIKQILMYECISETEFAPSLTENVFIPNYFIDISEFIEKKCNIMNMYFTEIGVHPFPRSEKNIKALAIFRGAIAGVEFAEAFQLLKFIDK